MFRISSSRKIPELAAALPTGSACGPSRRIHPLVLFGYLIDWTIRHLNSRASQLFELTSAANSGAVDQAFDLAFSILGGPAKAFDELLRRL
jgi:hypothetical protein